MTIWHRLRAALEVAASLALLAAGVATLRVEYVAHGRAMVLSRPAPSVYKAGQTLDVVGANDVAHSTDTLVMFVRDGCHYCEASMDFYKELQAAPRRHVRLLLAGSGSADALLAYGRRFGFEADGAVSLDGRNPKIQGTPTLVLVDTQRKVKALWVGRLDASRQAEVLKSID